MNEFYNAKKTFSDHLALLPPKVNRALVFSAEMPCKLRGWYARRKRDHVHCVDGRLEMWSEFV